MLGLWAGGKPDTSRAKSSKFDNKSLGCGEKVCYTIILTVALSTGVVWHS